MGEPQWGLRSGRETLTICSIRSGVWQTRNTITIITMTNVTFASSPFSFEFFVCAACILCLICLALWITMINFKLTTIRINKGSIRTQIVYNALVYTFPNNVWSPITVLFRCGIFIVEFLVRIYITSYWKNLGILKSRPSSTINS